MDIKLEGMCYVLMRANQPHPIAHRRHDLLWYPETGMTLAMQINYRPYVKSIVTECPWIVGCYKRRNVRMWDVEKGEFREPMCQTYGCSKDLVLSSMMGIGQTIPSAPLDGGRSIMALMKKVDESYKKAWDRA